MSLIINIWSGDRKRRHVCLFKDKDDIIEKVKGKFGISESVTLVLERDGSIVEPDYEMLSHLSRQTETLMVLATGQIWGSSDVEATSNQECEQILSATAASSSPQTPTSAENAAVGLGPFSDASAFRAFILAHPKVKAIANDLEKGSVTNTSRQLVVRVTTHKLVSLFSIYPSKQHLSRASMMLAEVLDMPAVVFYDPLSYDGFLPRCLQNFRRKLSDDDKKYTWSRKRKSSRSLQLSPASTSADAVDVAESQADDGCYACPRRVECCNLCIGKDSDAERDRLRLLSSERFDDMKSAALATFCRRRQWISSDKPLLLNVLGEYPKFQSTPQLLDLEFKTLMPDLGDFLSEFPVLMDQLWKHAQNSTIPAVQKSIKEAAGVELDWKAWFAIKVLCLLLRPSTKKRISGAEAMPSLCRIVPVGSSLETEAQELLSYSPVLLIQGEIGGTVTSVKVAAETKLIAAGSSVIEGVDRLFKIYWIFNMAYPENVSNIFKFMEHKVYKIKDKTKVSPTIIELSSYLSKYI